MTYTLLGADGRPYESDAEGQWGGHSGMKIYGRLHCPSALRAIARGGYVRHRVFFADEATAIAAGYRPCGTCCKDRYQAWKSHLAGRPANMIAKTFRTYKVNIFRYEKCLRDHAAGQVLGLVSVAGMVRAHCVREPRWV